MNHWVTVFGFIAKLAVNAKENVEEDGRLESSELKSILAETLKESIPGYDVIIDSYNDIREAIDEAKAGDGKIDASELIKIIGSVL